MNKSISTVRRTRMFNNLTNPTLLDDMLLDWTIFTLNNKGYSKEYLWKRFIRS